MTTYDFAKRERLALVIPGYDHADAALAALQDTECQLQVATREAEEAILAVTMQEAVIKALKASDFIGRELAIAPLRQLVPARDRAVSRAEELRTRFEQHTGQLAGGIAARRREIEQHRGWLAELSEELDRQERRLDGFAERYLPAGEEAAE